VFSGALHTGVLKAIKKFMSFRLSECISRSLRNQESISIRFDWLQSVSDAVVRMKFCRKSLKKNTSSICSSNLISLFFSIQKYLCYRQNVLEKIFISRIFEIYNTTGRFGCVCVWGEGGVNILTGINWNVISNTMQYDWSFINVFVAAVINICLQ
jgi:hypothetical protein